MRGGSGNDTIYGDGLPNDATQTGNDKLYGDTGDDTLNGGRGSDELHGGAGTNRLEGFIGPDKLVAEGTGDTLSGGRGNDILELNAATATIEFGSGDGSDAVQFDLASGTYTLKLIGLNAADIEVIGGGCDIYALAGNDPSEPDGTWYQFLTIRTGTGDQITFLENGIGATHNIGPSGNYLPIGYNKGFRPDISGGPTDEGQLDKIVFSDGSSWDQAAIWSHLTKTDLWAYDDPDHPIGYSGFPHPHDDTNVVAYVNETYLQAFTDYAAAQNPPSAPEAIQASTTGGLHFDVASDLACWP